MTQLESATKTAPPKQRIQQAAQLLDSKGIFTGGPLAYFEPAGRLQLITLLREGIYPQSKVLDLGCGCLRGGYWLIHFLDSGCYFGIEPNAEMLQAGIDHLLEPAVLEKKCPCFDNNDHYDFSVFGAKFDAVVARSIWTHASKGQIAVMLDRFRASSSEDAFFLTSYCPAGMVFLRRDYKGDGWKGRSHQSDKPGRVAHSFRWIREQVEARGMAVTQLPDFVFSGQHWLKITTKSRKDGGS
jgi:SAM-dependent methyltransferase